MKLRFAALSLLVLSLVSSAWAQKSAAGAISGTVFDPATGQPVEFATVTVHKQ